MFWISCRCSKRLHFLTEVCLCSSQISSPRGVSRRRHLWQRVVTHPMLRCLFLPFFHSSALSACLHGLIDGPISKVFCTKKNLFCVSASYRHAIFHRICVTISICVILGLRAPKREQVQLEWFSQNR